MQLTIFDYNINIVPNEKDDRNIDAINVGYLKIQSKNSNQK